MSHPTDSERNKGRWALPFALVPLALVGLWVLIVTQEQKIRSISPGCIFQRTTGYHCPGCGATRAVFALSKGDFGKAWSMNQALWLGIGIGLFYLIIAVLARRPGSTLKDRPWTRLSPRGAWVIIGAYMLFGILRNIPHWPFTLLAPH